VNPLAFIEYFLLVPEPVERTSLASTSTVSCAVTCSEETLLASASFEEVEDGVLARVSRTKRAFGFASALKMSLMV
jgi:hypothetical protein